MTTDANYGPGVTGCAGDIVDGAPIYANSCPDGFTYETDNGVKASTTGNISGIYDMVGEQGFYWSVERALLDLRPYTGKK